MSTENKPTVEQIMRLHRLTLKLFCRREKLTENEYKEMNSLEKQFASFDSLEVLNSEIEQLKAENNRLTYELDKSRSDHMAKYEQLKSKLKIAVEVLRGLNNEVAAMVATHGDVISQDYGRTNLECLEYRLNIARKSLSEIGEG